MQVTSLEVKGGFLWWSEDNDTKGHEEDFNDALRAAIEYTEERHAFTLRCNERLAKRSKEAD